MKFILSKKLILEIFTFCLLLLFFLLPQIIFAQGGAEAVKAGLDITAGEQGAGLDTTQTDLPSMIGRIINYLLGIIGAIFLTVILIGGFSWLTAGGNEEKVTKAKKLIINGINGLIVIFLAYGLVFVILAALKSAVEG